MIAMPAAVRADRLVAALGEDLPPALGQRLLDAPAVRPRLSTLLNDRLGAPAPDARLEQLLSMSAAGVIGLSLRAGVAWHSDAIVRLLDGGLLRTLAARLGFDPRPIALSFTGLTPAGSLTPGHDALADRIESDGAACLAAWCASLPSPACSYAQLVLPSHAALGADHAAYGPAVVAAVLDGMHNF